VTLVAAVEWGLWSDGCIRFILDGYNIPRGPLGLVLYLPFVVPYWFLPASRRSVYLWATSLLLALITLGPAYTATIGGLSLVSLAIIRQFAAPGRLRIGTGLLIGAYLALLLCPQPFWLPPVREPVYFYLHWAGIGYLFLRSYHVLADVAAGKMPPPGISEFLAFLLFAPTLRMGPLYRYKAFTQQLHTGPAAYRSFARASGRLVTALLRLGAMSVLIDTFPSKQLYGAPETLAPGQLVLHLYVPTMAIYLWMSAYIDLSLAVGRVLGFDVPDNFHYPWRATSIDDFWRRWHITLGAWLKDFIFIPLVRHRWHFFWSFTLTFLFCGLWHGMYLSYVLWGLSQGIGLGVRRLWGQMWRKQRESSSALYRWLTKLHLVNSPINVALCWLLTSHYQIMTINLALDEQYTWCRLGPRILALLGFDV